MVQHLQETSGTHFDSTIYGNNGTPYNLAGQGVSGKIGRADAFDRSGDLIDVGTQRRWTFMVQTRISTSPCGCNETILHPARFLCRRLNLSARNFLRDGTVMNEDDLRFLSPNTR